MGLSYTVTEFDEDHYTGQKLILVYNRTCDVSHVVYVDENGAAHECLCGSDPMIDALVKLIHSEDCRAASENERKLAYKTVFNK